MIKKNYFLVTFSKFNRKLYIVTKSNAEKNRILTILSESI